LDQGNSITRGDRNKKSRAIYQSDSIRALASQAIPDRRKTMDMSTFFEKAPTPRGDNAKSNKDSIHTSTTAAGKGLQGSMLKPGSIAIFTVTPNGNTARSVKVDVNSMEVKIRGPVTPKAEIFDNYDGTFDVEWKPVQFGTYVIDITLEGKRIKDSPFTVEISDSIKEATKPKSITPTLSPDKKSTHNKSTAAGHGLDGNEITIGDVAVFTVYSKDDDGITRRVAQEDVTVSVSGPSEPKVEVFDNEDGTFDIIWEPTIGGSYTLSVQIEGQPIKGSPFFVKIPGGPEGSTQPPAKSPSVPSFTKCKATASGTGLDSSKVKVGDVAIFTLYSKDKNSNPLKIEISLISVKITGPSNPKVELFDNDDASYDVVWEPSEYGEYNIAISIDNKPISGSPFIVKIGTGEKPPKYQETKLKTGTEKIAKENGNKAKMDDTNKHTDKKIEREKRLSSEEKGRSPDPKKRTGKERERRIGKGKIAKGIAR